MLSPKDGRKKKVIKKRVYRKKPEKQENPVFYRWLVANVA